MTTIEDPRRNTITLLLGKKKSGKSHRARELLALAHRRIVVDPMWEHASLGAIVRSFDELVRYVRALRHSRYGIVYRGLDPGDLLRVIALATAGTPDDPPIPGCTILIDEIDRVCSPSSLPVPIQRLINYGRHYQVSLIAAARRPKRIHPDLRAAADRLIIGPIQEPSDIEYFRDLVDAEFAERVKQATQAAAQLPDDQHPEFLEWEG